MLKGSFCTALSSRCVNCNRRELMKKFVLSSNDREELTLEYEGLRYVTSEKMHETISECFEK